MKSVSCKHQIKPKHKSRQDMQLDCLPNYKVIIHNLMCVLSFQKHPQLPQIKWTADCWIVSSNFIKPVILNSIIEREQNLKEKSPKSKNKGKQFVKEYISPEVVMQYPQL